MSNDLWQQGCARLAAELPEQQFNTWIRPLPPADVADEGDATVVSLKVPNRFKLDWIRSQYAARIEQVLSDVAGKTVRLELTLAARPAAPIERPVPRSSTTPTGDLFNGTPHAPDAAPDAPANVHGLRGMHGAYWEWTGDATSLLGDGDRRGQDDGNALQYCGASAMAFNDPADYGVVKRFVLLSALTPSATLGNLGFRCARSQP